MQDLDEESEVLLVGVGLRGVYAVELIGCPDQGAAVEVGAEEPGERMRAPFYQPLGFVLGVLGDALGLRAADEGEPVGFGQYPPMSLAADFRALACLAAM